MKSPKCLYTIELTRGMAALAILALHVILFGHDKYGFEFSKVMGISHFLNAGVDLFFIISGFLMVHTTRLPEQRDWKEFLLKRVLRIYPAYWVVLLCILPVYFFKPEWAFFGNAEKPSLLRSFLLLPQSTPPILAVAWTLVYEVYFYLLFTITLFLKPRMQVAVLMIYISASILCGIVLSTTNPLVNFIASPLLVEFLAGMILAHIWIRFPKSKILPIFCFAASILFLKFQPMQNLSRVIDYGIPALLVFIAMLSIEKNAMPFPDKIAHFFGRISYALYLVHVPIIAGLPRLLPKIEIQINPFSMMLMAITLSLLVGSLLHYGFEIPVQRKLRQLLLIRSKTSKELV